MPGWVNVDSVPDCNPDMVVDLEQFPWPWPDNSVEEILLSHVLEHLGEQRDVYLGIIKELYRVCCHGAKIQIMVPHPRHDHFLWDPTHVRPILVEGLQMFDQALNRQWIANKWANTPLGVYLGVDFRIAKYQYVLDPLFQERYQNKELDAQKLQELMRTHNNVCQQINIEWVAYKESSDAVAPQPSWPTMPQLPVAWGEVFDKLTILQIKAEKLQDAAKLANVNKERQEIDKVVGDLASLNQHIGQQLPGVPIILLGHSMGSYIAQAYLLHHSASLHGAILSGSNFQPVALYRAARLIARAERLRQGLRGRSALIEYLSFGSFNKAFKPNRTAFDWLSRDPDEVDRYRHDPLCGFRCTNQLWIDLLGGLQQISKASNLAQIDPGLPILVIGGECDPVSEGKRLKRLAHALREAGCQNLQLNIYPQARHELFNETNRDEVTADVLTWLDQALTSRRPTRCE